MPRISFDVDDLSNLRLMSPGPAVETMMAAQVLQAREPGAVPKSQLRWRKTVAPQIAADHRVRRLLELLPLVDLWMPAVGVDDVEDGLDRLLRLAPEYYRRELEMSAAARHPSRHVPRWTERLTERDPRPRRELLDGVRRLYDLGLREGLAEAGRTAARGFVAARGQVLALGGINRLMDDLHPSISWHSPVLSIERPGSPSSRPPLPAGGLGVVVTPSIFATRVQFHWDCNDRSPGVLVVPVAPPDRPAPPPAPRLTRLVGRRRAAILILLARGQLCTSDLAERCAISPGAVSEHTRVLREAGLITTDRSRRSTHRITPAGSALLGDSGWPIHQP